MPRALKLFCGRDPPASRGIALVQLILVVTRQGCKGKNCVEWPGTRAIKSLEALNAVATCALDTQESEDGE